jgi:hypothetical protein
MLRGEKTGEKLDIVALLQNTAPHFKTVEDAMQFSRKFGMKSILETKRRELFLLRKNS